ncbi:MAG: hypothetical protein ACXVA9_13035, partial [Bdellovibrionales bacterium]
MATYNSDCMKLLMPPVPLPIQNYYHSMVEHIHSQKFAQDLRRSKMQMIDYEVIYDITHGLPLRAVFADGTRENFAINESSLVKLKEKLLTTNVLVALYAPPALEKIRYILKNACIATEYNGCEAYDEYIGLMDNGKRPFNRREEQALKWATIFQMPMNSTATMFRKESR